MSEIPTDLQRLADRIAIQETLYRYARGIDRRNWDFLASAFHPGASIHQGDFKGSIEEMIESVKARHAAIEQSAHLMTNILVEFDGADGAVVETYYLAYLRNDALPAIVRTALLGGGAPDAGKIDMRSLGRYIDRFERRDGHWRIAKRVCIAETLSGQAVPEGNPLSTNWAMASRNPDDALWAMRAEFGLK
jgi:SnoaL-like domain